MDRYLAYSVDELIEDSEFVSLVLDKTKKEEWRSFILKNKGAAKNIRDAREIIMLFHFEEGKLQKDKKNKLWKNIESFNRKNSGKSRIVKLKKYSRIAAVITILLSCSSLLYLNFNKEKINKYQFSEINTVKDVSQPLLILSNGDNISLDKKDTVITVVKNQNAIKLNNEKIVKNSLVVDKKTKVAKLNEVIVPFGQKSNLVLEDGTKVWLNAGSHLAFPQKFDGKKREVFLEGEGYFEVTENRQKPFLVHTQDINIEVLGTKFGISAYKSDAFIQTTLLEGSVLVSENKALFANKVTLAPNQKAIFNSKNNKLILEDEPNAIASIAWINGFYPIYNERLDQVLRKLERYYNVSFEFEETLINETLPVSGKLDLKDSINELMTIISQVTKVDYQIVENKIVLSKK
uniref:FecR family protein n=1 Tax=uncultured Draconibacterium sp. TaxID=1573823 RepID=UPI003217529A